ncbi:hypothetical protein ACPCBC_16890 [Streptomyces incarnatus]
MEAHPWKPVPVDWRPLSPVTALVAAILFCLVQRHSTAGALSTTAMVVVLGCVRIRRPKKTGPRPVELPGNGMSLAKRRQRERRDR